MTLGETQSAIQLELILHASEAMLTDEEVAPNTFLFFLHSSAQTSFLENE